MPGPVSTERKKETDLVIEPCVRELQGRPTATVAGHGLSKENHGHAHGIARLGGTRVGR